MAKHDPGDIGEKVIGEPDWLSLPEATAFFGLDEDDIETLEDLVHDHEVDAQFDSGGNITAVDATDLREPLFAHHERRAGYRPDDEKAQKAERERHHRRAAGMKSSRTKQRGRFNERVKRRRGDDH